MFGSWFIFPGFKCWAADLSLQDSSVGQLNYLPKTQVIDSCFCLTRLKCWAVDLPSHDSSGGQLIYLPKTQVWGS